MVSFYGLNISLPHLQPHLRTWWPQPRWDLTWWPLSWWKLTCWPLSCWGLTWWPLSCWGPCAHSARRGQASPAGRRWCSSSSRPGSWCAAGGTSAGMWYSIYNKGILLTVLNSWCVLHSLPGERLSQWNAKQATASPMRYICSATY